MGTSNFAYWDGGIPVASRFGKLLKRKIWGYMRKEKVMASMKTLRVILYSLFAFYTVLSVASGDVFSVFYLSTASLVLVNVVFHVLEVTRKE